MIAFGLNTKVYLASGATDMRQCINGLLLVVQDEVEADVFRVICLNSAIDCATKSGSFTGITMDFGSGCQ